MNENPPSGDKRSGFSIFQKILKILKFHVLSNVYVMVAVYLG